MIHPFLLASSHREIGRVAVVIVARQVERAVHEQPPHLAPDRLAGWMIGDGFDARFQLQLHKLVWGPDRRGV